MRNGLGAHEIRESHTGSRDSLTMRRATIRACSNRPSAAQAGATAGHIAATVRRYVAAASLRRRDMARQPDPRCIDGKFVARMRRFSGNSVAACRACARTGGNEDRAQARSAGGRPRLWQPCVRQDPSPDRPAPGGACPRSSRLICCGDGDRARNRPQEDLRPSSPKPTEKCDRRGTFWGAVQLRGQYPQVAGLTAAGFGTPDRTEYFASHGGRKLRSERHGCAIRSLRVAELSFERN